jgi:Leucine-rich repeat (LRR) protein
VGKQSPRHTSVHLGRLTRLLLLQLGKNFLTGLFPESFSDLRKLEILYMNEHALTGNVPTMPSSMESMSIGFNFVTGTVTDFASLTSLIAIYLDSNLILGSIPESIFLSTTLISLQLRDNRIRRSLLISEVGNPVELELLDLLSNNMTGAIPSKIGLLTNLEHAFNGTIALQIGSLTRLNQLWLQSNQLSGSVPFKLSSLLSSKSIKLFARILPEKESKTLVIALLILTTSSCVGPYAASFAFLP